MVGRGEVGGSIGVKNIQSQYSDLKVHLPAFVIFHKLEVFHNHGEIFRFKREFKRIYGER